MGYVQILLAGSQNMQWKREETPADIPILEFWSSVAFSMAIDAAVQPKENKLTLNCRLYNYIRNADCKQPSFFFFFLYKLAMVLIARERPGSGHVPKHARETNSLFAPQAIVRILQYLSGLSL